MKLLLQYRKKYSKPFSIAVLFLTFEAFFDLLQPTIMAKIIDNGIAKGDIDYVIKMGGLMLLFTVFGAIAASTRSIISSHVSQKFGAELRADLFKKIHSLSFDSIDSFERASLVTRLTNDVTQVQNFVNGLMRIFVKAPLLCIGALIMAVRLNPQLAIVLSVVVPIVMVLIVFNMKVGFPFFIKIQNSLDRVNSVMREYLSGVRVIKAFNRSHYEINKFEAANEEFRAMSTNATRVLSIFNPSIMLTVNLGIIVVLWIGGFMVDKGQMQVGHIVAFTNYMTQILFSLMMISMVFNMFVRARASAGRINEVFSSVNHMKWINDHPSRSNEKGRVEFENVSFSYKGAAGEPLLKNISFTCMPGETIGIIGSTGSGKSSLVSLIPRFYDVTDGCIKVDGEDIRKMDPKVLRQKIAVVPQKTILFTGTVTENIRWGKDNATMEEIQLAARIAEASTFIESSPEGYATKLGQGGINYSGGQKQRVAIARALVRKPEILILDDSTSAVDAATEARIKQSVRQNMGNVTCFIIAQRISSIIDCDHILVMDDGQIVGQGTHEQLINTCRVYQEIYQSQMGKEVI